jgi:hypothetical protein
MEMLVKNGLFSPRELPNGVFAFAAPVGQGHVCMIALDDLAFYVDWIFSNPDKGTGMDLAVATEDVTWDNLVKTFMEVTGHKAVNANISAEEYFVFPVVKSSDCSLILTQMLRLPPTTLTLFRLSKTSAVSGLFGGTVLSRGIISCLTRFTLIAFPSNHGWRNIITTELASIVIGA